VSLATDAGVMPYDDHGTSRAGDLTPPQDPVAEQCVLGAMLISKDAIADVVEVIRGTDFYRPAHELIFDAVLDLYGRGEPADAITVADELTKRGEIGRAGGHVYLHDLIASVPVAANAGYYAEIVREKAILRRLVDASRKIAQLGYGQSGDVDSIVDQAQEAVYAVTERRTSEDYKPLSALMESTLDEIEAIQSHGGTLAGVPTGFAELDELTNGLHGGQMVIIAARPAMGKALAVDTPLPTPSGWTTMAEVQVGDSLLDAHGRPTTVVAATDVMTGRPCYRIEFSDGSSVVADAEHEWEASSRAARRAVSARLPERLHFRYDLVERVVQVAEAAGGDEDRLVTMSELVDEVGMEFRHVLHSVGREVGHDARIVRMVAGEQRRYDWHAPAWSRTSMLTALAKRIARPVGTATLHPQHMTTEQMAVDVRLDGRRRNWAIAVADPVQGSARDLVVPPYTLGVWLGDGPRASARISSADLHTRLRQIGVLNNKHIPGDYLRASVEQRRALLAGLLDTHGTVHSTGAVQFVVVNRRLADDVRELVTSLGMRCSMVSRTVPGRSRATSAAYILNFSTAIEVFRLDRQRDLHRLRRREKPTRAQVRYINEITPIAPQPVRCIQVDNPDHLYLATRSMIPTHNSTMGLDLARAASIQHGLCSAIFSLEMSQSEITMKLLSAEADIPLNHIRKGQMSEDDWTRLSRKMGDISESPLFIDDSPNLTMMEIRAKARRLKQRHDLKLVIIDYLQLMTSGKKVESRQLEVSEFSRQLKLLAKELNIPVVAICQLNRGPEQRTDKKPVVADLRESGSLEQDADLIILLHRDDYYNNESERLGEADLIVAKHRNGPTKTIPVVFQGHYSRFGDMQR